MGLRDRLTRPALGLGRNRAGPDDAARALRRALARQADRAQASSGTITDVQLLGQITGPSEWLRLRAHWEKRNPGGVRAWPAQLPAGVHALNLWPLPPGHHERPVGRGEDVRKRQPKRLLCTPGLTTFTPDGGDPHTALAVVCATWLEDIAMEAFPAIRLAPPILEQWAANGRLLAREVVDYDLPWSLPATPLAH